MPVTLRAATAADHAAIRALDPRLIAEAALPGATREDLLRFQRNVTDAALTDTNPNSRLIVAVDNDDRVQGYIHLKPIHDDVLDCETGYLNIIAVAENATSKGIGRLLMEAAENWAREQAYPSLLLDVFASNGTAREYYAKSNFIEDSVRLRRTI
jgi:GNAT superfamily N-acetyltransferase